MSAGEARVTRRGMGWRLWPAYVVLLVTFVPVPFMYRRLEEAMATQRRAHFEAAVESVMNRAELEFTFHLALLSGLRGLLAGSENVSPDEFRRYLESMDLVAAPEGGAVNLSSLREIGVALRVREGTEEDHVRAMRAVGLNGYQPRLLETGGDHFPIVYLRRFGGAQGDLVGMDLAGDPWRRAVMEQARDGGEAAATAAIETALSGEPGEREFTLFLPMYGPRATPSERAARREAASGFVFATYSTEAFWEKVEGRSNTAVRLVVFEGPVADTRHRIYPGTGLPEARGDGGLMEGYTANGLGRLWTFHYFSRAGLEGRPGTWFPLGILVVGTLSSLGLFVVVATLVRARVQAELMSAELRASEGRFRRVFEAIPDLYFRVDRSGVVSMITPSSRVILGYEPEEILGFRARRFATGIRALRRRLRDEEQVADVEVMVRRKGGEEIPFSLTAQVVRDGSGLVIGAEGMLRDIRVRKQVEIERLRSSKLESLGLLAGGIAHDFNNLLTAILANASFARLQVPEGGELGQTLEEMEGAALRARDLTRQLLTFAKGGAPVRKAARLGEVVQDSTRFVLRGSMVAGEYEFPEDLWPAEVDVSQLSQVVQNLALNAVQAMPEGGRLHVSASNEVHAAGAVGMLSPGPYIHLQFADTGVGIPSEHLVRVFDPFFSTKEAGSGLGLATAYSIVQRHDGRITVESQPGRGTRFHIWLPAAPLARVEQPSATVPLVRGGVGRVLVVDDEESIRQMAVRLLRTLGYQVETAVEGRQALGLIQAARQRGQSFTVVVLDLTIPGGMGGLEAVREIRRLFPGVRTVVSSGYSNDPVMANHRDFGFDGVLAKPYQAADLARVLHEVSVVAEVVREP